MMFNDRDLTMIGAGAMLAVLCLLLPVSFAGKVAAGLCMLVASLTFALLRLGRDRLPVEEWLKRRIRYLLRPRLWTFQVRPLAVLTSRRKHAGPGQEAVLASQVLAKPGRAVPGPVDGIAVGRPPASPAAAARATRSRLSESVGRILISTGSLPAEKTGGILLMVVGVYFLYGLWTGDAAALAAVLRGLLP